MPQAIPIILAVAKTAVGKLLIGAAINIGIGALQAKLNQPKGPKPRDLQTQIRSATADRVQHFGRVRVSGVLLFADFFRGSPTLDLSEGFFSPRYQSGNIACVLLGISTGGITGVDAWYLDGKPVVVDAEGWVQTSPWRDRVRLRARTRLGAEVSGVRGRSCARCSPCAGPLRTASTGWPPSWASSRR